MRFRKLRIAWSVFWGVGCVLLIALWVRSYYVSDQAFMRVSTLTGYNFTSMQGQLTLRREAIDTPGIGFYGNMGIPDYVWNSFPPRAFLRYRTIFGFDLRELPNFIIFAYWAPVFVCALLAPAPYLNRRKLTRFRLRTLLIVTALVALALGAILLSARKPLPSVQQQSSTPTPAPPSVGTRQR